MRLKKKQVLIILAAVFVAAVLAVVLWPGEKEPEYQARKLSEWVDRASKHYYPKLGFGASDKELEECKAIRGIGTNAIPYLLKWLRFERSEWRQNASHIYVKLPSKLQSASVRRRILGVEPRIRREGAVVAFWVFEGEAHSAVDDLYLLALDPKFGENAIHCLEGIGRPAVPALTKLTESSNASVERKHPLPWTI